MAAVTFVAGCDNRRHMNAPTKSRLPAGVWALGLVSLFMDVSSEMIHSLLPVFLVGTLGVSALALGVIEGVAEATANIVKLFSGALSDWMGRRKPLALLGYGVAALTKPLFPLADSVVTVFTARFLDRIGKGIRGAPRDALVAGLTPPEQRGAAFGLRQSMDTTGAFLGPLLAIGLMLLLADNIRAVFWFATIPAAMAVVILWIWVREPKSTAATSKGLPDLRAWRRLPRPFWWLVGLMVMFTLARFSEAFLVLRVHTAGLSLPFVPLVLVAMNLAYALSAYPAGRLSDRLPRTQLLGWGCAVLIAADLLLAFGEHWGWTLAGAALWGFHMGLTEGLLAAMVADCAPAALLGTAYGITNFARGIVLLVASVLAGALWTFAGPAATFLSGAAFALLTVLALRFVPPPPRTP